MAHGVDNYLSKEDREENAVAQSEEVEALEAIYGDDIQVVDRDSAAPSSWQIRLRVSETPLVSLHLRLPEGYPSRVYPEYEIRAPGLSQEARTELSQALYLREETGGELTASPGTVVVFDWAETLRDLLSSKYGGREQGLSTNYHPGAPDKSGYTISGHEGAERKEEYNSTQESGDRWGRHGDMAAAGEAVGAAASAEDVEASVEIVHGEPFTDRKSTFQAHLARVSSEQQVIWVRHRLMENSKIARATHNIAAWRIWDANRGVQLHDNDDDGESAAGSRLAHMMSITGAQNVLVVVSRWYGGIHLGPDRFKHINNAARELLVRCGATSTGNTASSCNSAGGDSRSVSTGVGGGKPKGRRRRGSAGGGGGGGT